MLNVSYAQNFEDVMIWRLFPDHRNGFYIDVGAAHPVKDSVTAFFYKKGWNGINIEPNREYFNLLANARSRDVNIHGAVSDEEGEAVFRFVKNDPKLSSIEPLPQDLIERENLNVIERKTKVMTLAKIIEEYKVKRIDFLKIDAEGAEAKVLGGFPFDKIKPRLIVVESVEAKSRVSTKMKWEPILERHNYVSAYNDGINDYYVQKQDREALEALSVPLNSTDNFIRFEHTKFKFFFKNLRKRYFKSL